MWVIDTIERECLIRAVIAGRISQALARQPGGKGAFRVMVKAARPYAVPGQQFGLAEHGATRHGMQDEWI